MRESVSGRVRRTLYGPPSEEAVAIRQAMRDASAAETVGDAVAAGRAREQEAVARQEAGERMIAEARAAGFRAGWAAGEPVLFDDESTRRHDLSRSDDDGDGWF